MKPLKIAILAQLNSPTITEQLAPVLRERGHTVDILDVSDTPEEKFIEHSIVKSLINYDMVYYRSGLDTSSSPNRVLQLELFLKDTPVKTVNLHYTKHPLAHSKSYETQQADKAGVLIPKSVYSSAESFTSLSTTLGLPFVTKTDQGTNGLGVHLVKTVEESIAIQNKHPETKLLHQEFIPHDFEYRVYVINGDPICMWKKAPAKDDFKSNEAQGGGILTGDQKYTEKLTELTKKITKVFDFDVFVVDFMLNKKNEEFYFTEINLNPGWGQILQYTTDVDGLTLTADYFEEICCS